MNSERLRIYNSRKRKAAVRNLPTLLESFQCRDDGNAYLPLAIQSDEEENYYYDDTNFDPIGINGDPIGINDDPIGINGDPIEIYGDANDYNIYDDNNDEGDEDDDEDGKTSSAAHLTSNDNNFDIEGFSILMDIEEHYRQNPPDLDDGELLMYKNSPSTVVQFGRELKQVLARNNATKKLEMELLLLLSTHMPVINFPIRQAGQTAVSTTSSSLKNNYRILRYDLCAAGCTAFVGRLSDKIVCPVCGFKRFSHCNVVSCRHMDYSTCPHSHLDRTPLKSLYYRPLTFLVYSLLQTQHFLRALKYTNVKPSANIKYKYMDVQDGSTFKKTITAMNRKYQEAHLDISVLPVNIVLSLFYDAAQIYSTKVSNFSPLLVTILNLPPSYRNKSGK